MTVINFTITKPLEKKINKAIKEQGFTSKAEFFRFAAFQYLQETKDQEYEETMKSLARALELKYKGKKMLPLEEQLEDI